jgi:two-component system chemotaxis response regulator CheY
MAHVLIVENDDDTREAMENLLGMSGYTVESSADGLDALDRLRELPRPCVMTLDLRMPLLDGNTVLEEMSRDEKLKDIPVIVTTGSVPDAKRCENHANVRIVLVKPFAWDDLLAAVEDACEEKPDAVASA